MAHKYDGEEVNSNFAYFHREFLGNTDDPDSDEAIIARVMNTGDDHYAYASLSLNNEYGGVLIRFDAGSEKDINKSMSKVELLEKVVSEFAQAVRMQLNQVMENINKSEEK